MAPGFMCCCAVTLEGSKFYEDCSCFCHPRCEVCGRGHAVATLTICPPCAGGWS